MVKQQKKQGLRAQRKTHAFWLKRRRQAFFAYALPYELDQTNNKTKTSWRESSHSLKSRRESNSQRKNQAPLLQKKNAVQMQHTQGNWSPR